MRKTGSRVTIRDIANEVGVSATVVSQVLRGVEGSVVSNATRERVLRTARELGYRPNRLARALVGGKTQTVALWRHGVYTPFHASVMHEATKAANADGYEVIIRDFAAVREQSVWVHVSDVDGILAHECVDHVRMLLAGSPSNTAPIVSMGVFTVPECDHVTVDLYTPTCDALRHLLQNGRRRLAYVAIGPVAHASEPRYAAYCDVLAQEHLKPALIAVPDGSRRDMRSALRDMLRSRPLPDGFLCHNDDLAIVCLRALHDLGVRIPDDAAVVGCDGIPETEFTVPELSTIAQPVELMCRHAWNLLRERLEQPGLPAREIVLPAELVIRESSASSRLVSS